MNNLLRILIGLFMPVILIVGGGWLFGYAIDSDSQVLFWMSLALIAAGLIWGLVLWLWSSGSLL